MIDNRNFAPPPVAAGWYWTGLLIALVILYSMFNSFRVWKIEEPVEIEQNVVWDCMPGHGPEWDKEGTPGY